MKYSTERKGRSRLQGHRKRRKALEVVVREEGTKIDWLEYKTLRQYQTMSDLLTGNNETAVSDKNGKTGSFVNGCDWLTKDL